MSDAVIACPECGHRFAISDALCAQLESEVATRLNTEHEARLARAVVAAEAKAHEQDAAERQLLKQQLTEQQDKVRLAQAAELALRREKGALEERQRELDLEVARKVDAEKQRLESLIRKAVGEEQGLKIKEKEKQIDDLKKLLDEAKRKSEQGSQELQGEVLELDVQAALERQFPQDLLKPVPKGIRGADLIHEVRDSALRPCGSIVWETKNTRNWSGGWIAKLKEDQRAVGANLAVLVSIALPDGFGEFGQIEGVWVTSLRVWPAVAVALREQLTQVAYAHAAAENKHDKMDTLYRYLCGDQFRQRVQGIVEAFTEMQEQINRERRAMERIWREREKQVERVITNTVGMYGEMQGIVGKSLPKIAALELDCSAVLESEAEPLLDQLAAGVLK